MDISIKAKLTDKLQEWLDDEEVVDVLGGAHGIWQDDSMTRRNANILANAVEAAIDAAALQSTFSNELG